MSNAVAHRFDDSIRDPVIRARPEVSARIPRSSINPRRKRESVVTSRGSSIPLREGIQRPRVDHAVGRTSYWDRDDRVRDPDRRCATTGRYSIDDRTSTSDRDRRSTTLTDHSETFRCDCDVTPLWHHNQHRQPTVSSLRPNSTQSP